MGRQITELSAETDPVQSAEKITVGWDFFAELASGEQIQSKAVKAFKRDGTDVTLTVVASSTIVTGDGTNSMIAVVLQSLVAGEYYDVQMIATISASKVLEADLFVPVRNIP